MPNVKSPADSEPGVAGRGLDVNFFERSLRKNFSVGDAVVSHPAGQAKLFYAVSFVKPVEHRMHGFFEPRLQRRGDIPMAPLDRLIGLALRAKPFYEVIAVKLTNRRLATVPRHLRAGLVVHEVFEAEGKPKFAIELDDLIKIIVGTPALHRTPSPMTLYSSPYFQKPRY